VLVEPKFGALVVSLDFEIHWGLRDTATIDGDYRQNFLGVRQAVPAMLGLFEEFEIAATWATVGMLFATSKQELAQFSPAVRPQYSDRNLSPYEETVGEGEQDDLFHYAPTLISAIRASPRQEIGTHTFSHYYCLEPGQDERAFAADLESAVAIARHNGVRLRSIVFPRNQHNPKYDRLLTDAGIVCFRGNQRQWMYRASGASGNTRLKRAARLADNYLNLTDAHSVSWETIRQPSGLANVPASFFLRPFSRRLQPVDFLRLRRISRSIERAAKARELVHLWWHPHNFGVDLTENLLMLRSILEVFAGCRKRYGMRSLSMAEAADVACPD
jgi:peptidoglycan/xylan/chitin deacetylase (PgdA/CDA1 family)